MERNINNKDFEQFIKKNADQYRMYPSEKVWKGVYSALHTRRRWYGIGLGLLLLSAVAVTWVMTNTPSTKQLSKANQSSASKLINTTQKISPDEFISSTIQHNNQKEILLPKETESNSVSFPELANNSMDNSSPVTLTVEPDIAANSPAISKTNTIQEKPLSVKPLEIVISDQATDNESDLNNIVTQKTSDSYIPQPTTAHKDKYPLTIESVLNTYKAGGANSKGKTSLQFFFTPTVSYRKLSENKSVVRNTSTTSIAGSPSSFTSLYGINNVVTHKPDMGIEFGLTAGYPLSKNFKLIGGLQFNISRYGIKAYTTYGEIATVALDRGSDSIATWSNYRNFSGSNTNWLQNYYFSVSAPIGAEYRLFNGNKTQFGVSATLQPSYMLGDRAYLITTDYKNYVEIPWLIRRWNLNTSIETFVGYTTGKITWHVGPQVRYQVFSSFQNKYPVKENLFDFGLKVGIMLNK